MFEEQSPTLCMEALSIERVGRLMLRFPRVADRFFTETEIAYCRRHVRRSAQHYAARLAAKFALRRLVGGGKLRSMEVVNDQFGAPHMHLADGAAAHLRGQTVRVSLSHDGDVAVALVSIENRR